MNMNPGVPELPVQELEINIKDYDDGINQSLVSVDEARDERAVADSQLSVKDFSKMLKDQDLTTDYLFKVLYNCNEINQIPVLVKILIELKSRGDYIQARVRKAVVSNPLYNNSLFEGIVVAVLD